MIILKVTDIIHGVLFKLDSFIPKSTVVQKYSALCSNSENLKSNEINRKSDDTEYDATGHYHRTRWYRKIGL